MKKLLSTVAAGALLFSAVSAVFAFGSTTTQGNFGTQTTVTSVAVSNSGLNGQHGGGFQSLSTGGAYSSSNVLSVANQNGTGSSFGSTTQGNFGTHTTVTSVAGSNSGLNSQSGSGFSVQSLHTGTTGSHSSVSSWANINLSGVSLSI